LANNLLLPLLTINTYVIKLMFNSTMKPSLSIENSIEYARPYRNGGLEYRPLADQIMVVNRALILNECGEVLLIQKDPLTSQYGGSLWHPPGGKQEIGEIPSTGVRREVGEETGFANIIIDPDLDSPLHEHYDPIRDGNEPRGILRITRSYVAFLPKQEPQLSREEAAHAWVKPRTALDEPELLTPPAFAALSELAATQQLIEDFADH